MCQNVLTLSNCVHEKNYSVKVGSICFFSFSDIPKFYYLLGYCAVGINSSFTFFKFNMPSQKSDKNDGIRIIFIKIIIKINIIKIYTNNTKQYKFF